LLETREAQRLESVISSGRTRPLVIECSRSATSVNDDDTEASNELEDSDLYVVKGFDLPEITNLGLFNEIFGIYWRANWGSTRHPLAWCISAFLSLRWPIAFLEDMELD
jgi:hypothetical protein